MCFPIVLRWLCLTLLLACGGFGPGSDAVADVVHRTVYRCTNCNHVVRQPRVGETCPHCEVVWAAATQEQLTVALGGANSPLEYVSWGSRGYVVPLRPLCKLLGASLHYREPVATVQSASRTLQVTLNRRAVRTMIEGRTTMKRWSTAPYLYEGAIYVPLRAFCQSLGLQVHASGRAVYLTPAPEQPRPVEQPVRAGASGFSSGTGGSGVEEEGLLNLVLVEMMAVLGLLGALVWRRRATGC